MARFTVDNADKYGGQGGGGYFKLVNDKDTARVRFLFDGIEDCEGYAVHEVKLDDKKRYVNCLREYGAPVSDCPFCEAKQFVTVKYFIPVYNIDEERTQTWERGKKFGQKLSSLCGRYPHLVTHKFEIERNGKAGEQTTTYEIYPLDGTDDVKVEDFEVPEILGSIVLDKTPDDMRYFLERGYFPDTDGYNATSNSSNSDDGVYRRRTPSNRGDRF